MIMKRCSEAAAAAVRAENGWVWDGLYMDDSQIVLPGAMVDFYLEAFDAALAACGGTRLAADGSFKSFARALGPPSQVGVIQDGAPFWAPCSPLRRNFSYLCSGSFFDPRF